MKKVKELSLLSIGLGILIAVVMTAANTYLGLYAGMTVSASIPAAVIAMAVLQGVLRRRSPQETNIVQTIASAGESLAAGVIFTVPALVIIGVWNDFQFWPTTLIAMIGGLLGVIFMIPLRKALIQDDKTLTYPEGVACASVIESGTSESRGGLSLIVSGLFVGAVVKFLSSGMKLLLPSVEFANRLGNRQFFFGFELSPALVAIGYIVRLEIAVLVFLGGAIAWFVGIPLLGTPEHLLGESSLDVAWALWDEKIRFVGVGSMIVAGMWSLISVRKGISSGLRSLKRAYTDRREAVHSTERDLGLVPMLIIFLLCLVMMFSLYEFLISSIELSLLTTGIMIVASFLFVAVSSYMVGLVGSSNNPVSGMAISALLGSAALFLFYGFVGESAILATLGVAAVVCCAACTAGDCSQDLKTGAILKTTPRSQQIGQIIGVVVPAAVIAPVLTLLHQEYVIGEGLRAPQAALFGRLTSAMFGAGDMPMDMLNWGFALGIFIIILDRILAASGIKFRLHLMPMAVGIYLPVTLAVPILFGGLIHFFVHRRDTKNEKLGESGVLASSGIIAGEALTGVFIAILSAASIPIQVKWLGLEPGSAVSIAVMGLVLFFLTKKAKS
ncbi:MAG: oligopeptide transporter, OPT family [Bradymonadales bacterium]|nr:MAG: oligopeptide transporter, OPT family [Bradymonadales bacterium]